MSQPPTSKPTLAPPPPARTSLRALAHITMAAAIGAAFVGFFVGLGAGVPSRDVEHEPVHIHPEDHGEIPVDVSGDIPGAVRYVEMPDANLGANAQWVNKLPEPAAQDADLFAALSTDPQLRAEALAKRAASRAYEGAPPVVPHAIDQLDPASCVACHGQGMKIGSVVAPKMSHPAYNNCTQCHVEGKNPVVKLDAPPMLDNRFVGLEAPGKGERAWEGAPPTIPHSTWMWQDCASCHGTFNEAGLRSSHPWRTNCTQCHAPSAKLDQRTLVPALRPSVALPSEDLP